MNGIEKITARIQADAQRDADAVTAEAAERCKEMRLEYDQKAQDAYWLLVRAGVKDCEERVKRLGSAAALEAKKSVLGLKQEMVAEVFDRAVEMLLELPKKEYVDLLAGIAAKAAGNGFEELVFNSKDQRAVGEMVAKAANELLKERGNYGKLTVSELTRDIKGGVIVKQGDIETNCSIEAMVGQYKSELSAPVAAALFDN